MSSLTKYYYGGQINGDEMGRARNMHERNERCIRHSSRETRREEIILDKEAYMGGKNQIS